MLTQFGPRAVWRPDAFVECAPSMGLQLAAWLRQWIATAAFRWHWSRERSWPARQHLDDLVSIAVASVRPADDAVQQAHQASTRARRGIRGFTCIAGLVVVVGIAGIADHRLYCGSDRELAAKAGDGPSIAEPQRHASRQLDKIEDEVIAKLARGRPSTAGATCAVGRYTK